VVGLTAALEAETARAARLARCVASEVEKRESSQDKGRRLLAERLDLETEVTCLRLKRSRTAQTLRAVRLTLHEERLAAGHHFTVRNATEVELLEVRTEAQLLLAQSTHAALGLAKLCSRAESLRIQLTALQELHSELRFKVGCLKLEHGQRMEALGLEVDEARAVASKAEREAIATAEAHARLLDEVDRLGTERTSMAAELEHTGEVLERALVDAEQGRMNVQGRKSEVLGLQAERDAAREEAERLRGELFALQLENQQRKGAA
jgi:hypothetical protein